jgi:glycosyltransferase involved in cell wall biosynthesis
MKIAVNIRTLRDDYPENLAFFIEEVFKEVVSNQSNHQFFFFSDRPMTKSFAATANSTFTIIKPAVQHPLLRRIWYDIKLPLFLKKSYADLLISCDGCASLKTNISQLLFTHNLSFLDYPAIVKKQQRSFYKRSVAAFLNKASHLLAVSSITKEEIVNRYSVSADKIDVLYAAPNNLYRPLSSEERESVKEKYTEGKEYFVCTGMMDAQKNLKNLLKAFSLFKKRQQTSLKLVLAGDFSSAYLPFKKEVETYKYRNDVVLAEGRNENELANIISSAYAMLHVPLFENFAIPVLNAMQCGVPVIATAGSVMENIAGEAALYTEATDITAMADQMMRIYKDENLRSVLIKKGFEKISDYTWKKTADQLWAGVLKSVR